MTNFEIRYKLCHVMYPDGYSSKQYEDRDGEIFLILMRHQSLSETETKVIVSLSNSSFFWKEFLERVE